MVEEIPVFPCQWPEGYPVTHPAERIYSSFKQTPGHVQKELNRQLDLLGATNVVVSSNLPVKKDGSLYANHMKLKIANDPSVAVYFTYKKEQVVLCCDKYYKLWENLWAIVKTVEAMRGIERWGVSDFIKRSFTGFAALPPAKDQTKSWWAVLGFPYIPVNDKSSYEIVKTAYRNLAKRFHPDSPEASHTRMIEINEAWMLAKRYFNES